MELISKTKVQPLLYTIYQRELNKLNQMHQSKMNLQNQLEVLRIFANKLGLYDASDFLRSRY